MLSDIVYRDLQNQKGFSLVETIVALLILSLIGSAVVTLIVQTAGATNCAKLRNEAVKYAEEGLEQARDYKQHNWPQLIAIPPGACYVDGKFSAPTSCNNPTQMLPGLGRAVSVTSNQPSGQVGVRSVVKVAAKCAKNGSNSIEVNTFFYPNN